MEKIQEMTGLSIQQISQYSLIFGVVCVMFGIGSSYITCVLGVAYPVFMTFLSMESNKDQTQWLTYWVIFGICSVIDQFAGFILQFIPFYYFLKLAFLVWLFHPKFSGATVVYDAFVRPNIHIINQVERDLYEKAGSALDDVKKMAGISK